MIYDPKEPREWADTSDSPLNTGWEEKDPDDIPYWGIDFKRKKDWDEEDIPDENIEDVL